MKTNKNRDEVFANAGFVKNKFGDEYLKKVSDDFRIKIRLSKYSHPVLTWELGTESYYFGTAYTSKDMIKKVDSILALYNHIPA